MRTLRRVTGFPRWKSGCMTDLQVRVFLDVPSIECMISQARLKYLAQILKSPAVSLRALLAWKDNCAVLPWVQLLLQDLHMLRDFHRSKLEWLGAPKRVPSHGTRSLFNIRTSGKN